MKNMIAQSFGAMKEDGRLLFDEPLSRHCSFKIGGPADYMAIPASEREFTDLLIFALENQLPFFILGNGSNLLISDKGYRGLIIKSSGMNKLSRDELYISAYAGTVLSQACSFARDHGLAGLEFASGIPGTVGGAVYMNAGAYGGEIKDRLYFSRCLRPDLPSLKSKNPVIYLKNVEHVFAYRKSSLQTNGLIILSSAFKLEQDSSESIAARMDDLKQQRNSKQPMEMPSAGSVFKRPEGHFTGKLIDDCGLRGYRIGDAAISEKHCGFIVNMGKASFRDVYDLIQHVRKTVKERFGVDLETEIRLLGEL
ncbi:MAG TPA: UDP-N-acetylmuramate dehydrogenase [Candidatus Cloacimonadota bacterium]|nr:UDP-N-acetylmuramate dehydrogenase [Candidatus Cloacimonadota bacterium]